MEVPNIEDYPKEKWHRTRSGRIFLAIIILLLLALLAFAGLMAYYMWEIKYGDADKLAEEFGSGRFSANVENTGPREVDLTVSDFIRDFNPIEGADNAPVTVVMFIDFECPFCIKGYDTIQSLRQKYAGVVRFVFKNFPSTSLHPSSEQTATAGMCAQNQNMFWQYYETLFENGRYDSFSILLYAKQLQLDLVEFSSCVNTGKTLPQVDQDLRDGLQLKVIGTPTYFINQLKVEGLMDEDEWDKILIEQIQSNK